MNKNLRRHFFIDKPFQLRFIIRFSVLILISLGISLSYLGVINYYRYNKGMYIQFKSDPETLEMLSKQSPEETVKDVEVLKKYFDMSKTLNLFQLYWKPIVYISILYIIVICIFGIFISHKMAGPVFRIKRTLTEASEGKIDVKTLRFRLRKKDELQDLAEALNKFIEKKVAK